MKALILAALLTIPAFANYPLQVSICLNAGATHATIRNTGSVGTDLVMGFNPPATRRVRLTVSPIFVPPASGTTYTDTADYGIVSINRQWGQQYYWVEYADSSCNPLSPRQLSQPAGAYATNSIGGLGTLPMVEPSVTTTAPLPMPREIIGQDGYTECTQAPLESGHAYTSIRQWVRGYSFGYNSVARSDGKVGLKVNSGAWLVYQNSNTALHIADEQAYYNRVNSGYQTSDLTSQPLPIGGYPQTRKYLMDLADGTIGQSDTTATTCFRHQGTEGVGSGAYILESYPVEGTDKTISQIVCTSNVCVGTSTSHGFSSGQSIVIRGASWLEALNGPVVLTSVTTHTFTFTPHAMGSGGSKAAVYVVPDGTYTVPVNRNPIVWVGTTQPVMYATRMLVSASAFTYTVPSTWTAPAGGDATRGGNLFIYGNTAGTPGQFNQLSNPQTPYLANTFHFAKCGSCHATDGKDLKYYNFSNHSIQQRTYFHGLTEQDGLDIAAYIRGLAIAVPTQARPWNPPMQTGPGMDNGTWKIGGTLTNIIVSNVGANIIAIATTTVAPNIKIGDPVYVYGASDADLNGTWTAFLVTGTTIQFEVNASVSTGTYTTAGMTISMANDFMAGCGVDCVAQYGFGEVLASLGTDKTKWVWNSHIDPRKIVYQYQFADWNKGWLPTVFPDDAVPSAGFLTSTPYLNVQTLLSCMTPGDFTTYKSCGYGSDVFSKYLTYWGRGPGEQGSTPPNTTDKFWLLDNGAPGWYAPSTYNLFRQSLIQMSAIAEWELNVAYGAFPMYNQSQIDRFPTGGGTYPEWGISDKAFTFNVGSHKVKMDQHSIVDARASSYNYGANNWYQSSHGANNGGGLDGPDSPIDLAYDQAFLDTEDQYRPGGYNVMILDDIIVPQFGNQYTNFAYFTSPLQDGLDWAALMLHIPSNTAKYSYYWFTVAEYAQIWDDKAVLFKAMLDAHNATYWNTTFINAATFLNNGSTTCTGVAAFNAGNTNLCDYMAAMITRMSQYGTAATSTQLAAIVSFLKTIPVFSTNYFDAAVTAGVWADTGDYGTGTGFGTAGSGKILTFSSCPGTSAQIQFPQPGVVISSTGGEVSEVLYPTGGTCGSRGGAGTLTFTTARAHDNATIKGTWGCGKQAEQNYPADLFGAQTRSSQCTNMP